jgi:hypothetical protein
MLSKARFGQLVRRLWITSCLPAVLAVSLLAQGYEYRQYTTKDGLPTNYVYGVIEDDDGYIWAYTENGLAKFDGYTFQHFSTQDGLPTNDIPHAAKTKDGKIWLFCYQNRPAYLFRDSITVVSDLSLRGKGMIAHKDWILYPLKDGSNLVYQDRQLRLDSSYQIDPFFLQQHPELFRLDSVIALTRNKKRLHPTPYLPAIRNDSLLYYSGVSPLYGIFQPEGGVFYSADLGKVYTTNQGKTSSFTIPSNVLPSGNPGIYDFFELEERKKYLFQHGVAAAIMIDLPHATFDYLDFQKPFDLPVDRAWISFGDSTFLVSTNVGLLEYDLDGRLIDQLEMKDIGQHYFLLRSYKDSRGNIWIGSREGGLFFIPAARRQARLLSSAYSADKAYERLISTASGRLLGITDNTGVYEITGPEIQPLLLPDRGFRFRSAIRVPAGIILASDRKGYLLQDSPDSLHFFSFQEVYAPFQLGENTSLYLLEDFSKFLNRSSLAYHPQQETVYSTYADVVVKHHLLNSGGSSISTIRIYAKLLYYHPFRKQVFAWTGEQIVSIENGRARPLITRNEWKQVIALYGTARQLWIGTESNGLFVYTFPDQRSEDGSEQPPDDQLLKKVLDAPLIRNIRPDTDSTLLIATNNGIYVLAANEPYSLVAHYTTENGLPTNEIRDVYGAGRYLYAATDLGLSRLDREYSSVPVLAATDLQLMEVRVNKQTHWRNERPYGNDATTAPPSFSFRHSENTLDMAYHLRAYASEGSVQYFTRLTPLEEEWQPTNERQVNYLSLPAGQYQFDLKARDVYGNEVALPALAITIREAWWRTTWFRLLLAAFIIGLVARLIYRRDRSRLRKLQEEKSLNRRMAELELSALRAQMNPHFVFNAMGAIQYYIQVNDVQKADSYLTRFAQLMRKYLDHSKEKMVLLREEVELLKIYTGLEQLRFEDLFDVVFEVDEDLLLDNLFVPSMLIQPFVENAVNHGLNERRDERGLLSIHFFEKGESLICRVCDNGIGRERAKQIKRRGHHSRAISIINDRIKTLEKSGIVKVHIEVKDNEPGHPEFPGTCVTISIKNLEEDDL